MFPRSHDPDDGAIEDRCFDRQQHGHRRELRNASRSPRDALRSIPLRGQTAFPLHDIGLPPSDRVAADFNRRRKSPCRDLSHNGRTALVLGEIEDFLEREQGILGHPVACWCVVGDRIDDESSLHIKHIFPHCVTIRSIADCVKLRATPLYRLALGHLRHS